MGDISCDLAGVETHEATKWSLNVNYLYFRSHRHFVSSEEQYHRREERTEVVNLVNQMNTSLSYQYDARTSFNVNVPYFHAVRSSLYEHDRVNRFKTRSQGFGDVTVGAQRWLFSPMSEKRTNVALGLGLKMPTGNTNVKDVFHTTNGLVRRNVDQSIQPGDGGWGLGVSAQGYQRVGENTSIYATGFYLINPQETNGTYRSTNPITGRDSVADQYQLRAGVTHVTWRRFGLTTSLGLRMEGVPALDLVGGDSGFRRPGYTVSVEPGISIMNGKDSFSLSVPWSVRRSRQKSYVDRINDRHGDAAFADFLINFSYARRW